MSVRADKMAAVKKSSMVVTFRAAALCSEVAPNAPLHNVSILFIHFYFMVIITDCGSSEIK